MEDVQAIEDLVDTYLGVEDESDVEEAKATLRDKIETLVEDEEQRDFPRCSFRRLSGYGKIDGRSKATLRDKIETLGRRGTKRDFQRKSMQQKKTSSYRRLSGYVLEC
ncbi:hypothetical protein [Dolosigranulum savutiense]|uniref:Uncharacterized protein n=1 Tax=Dolosigranulum savutiense TaxID=3110288 RepID=A0AB74TXL8_9LACT